MTFPRYADYKDSGVEWLGEVPAHWGVVSLKRDIAFLTSGSRGWAEHYSDDGVLFLRIGNLTRDSITLDLSDIQRVNLPDGAEGERTRVVAGDVLFSITAYLGSVAVAPKGLEEAYVSQHVALVRLHQRKFIPAWVGYVTLSNIGISYLETRGYGGTKVQLSLDDVANLIVTTPPLPEQTAIAAFLDHETGKIDALVAEQEKLIALLKEKRQAVISHAVTKGLAPSAPLKDSGVEWLGEVPEHWNSTKLKYAASFSGGGTPSRDNRAYWNGNIPWVSPKDMKAEEIHGAEESITEDGLINSTSNLVAPSTVLMVVRSGILKHTIPVAINRIEVALNQDMKALTLQPDLCLPHFFLRWVQGLNDELLLAWAKQGATVESLEQEYLANTIIPLPPLPEQTAIVAYLDTQTAKFDTLTAEAERAIALLKERRSALISAAVTGKIDVRWFVAPTPQEAA